MNNILCGNTYVMMIDVIGKSFCSQHKYTAYKNFLNKIYEGVKVKQRSYKSNKRRNNCRRKNKKERPYPKKSTCGCWL